MTSNELKDKEKNLSFITRHSLLKLSILRRFIMFGIIGMFLLQLFRIKVLVGSLSGSLVLWFINLIDVFAFFESLVASKDFTTTALISALPIIGIYLISGRAFCGWICPMDFLYEMVDKIRGDRQKAIGDRIKVVSPKIGYGIAVTLLVISGLFNIPLFSRYLSHLTNFFRTITSGVYLASDLLVEPVVLLFSGSVIFALLLTEYFFPRVWCRVLCPVGKTYGLFNKVSLLRLKFREGQCGECSLCEQMCYMKVKITPYLDQAGLRDINCIYCGRCVEGCATKGKLLKMKLGGD